MGATKALVIVAALTVACVSAAAAPEIAKIHPSVGERFEARGGPLHVWVFFEDKGPIDTAAALNELQRTYNPRAIERRRLRRTTPGLFDERDLAVHQAYLDAVATTGATLRTASRWVNGVSVVATRRQVRRIAGLSFVEKIQPVRRVGRQPGELEPSGLERPTAPATAGAGGIYGLSQQQLEQINVIALHGLGFRGEGVIIGVLDTGFVHTHEAFNSPGCEIDIVAEYDFLNDDPNVGIEPGDHPNQHHHGTHVLGTMGACNPGILVGGAYEASYILAKVEDYETEYLGEENLFVAGLEFIEANGGDVMTSSVVIYNHYAHDQLDGLTSVMTIGFNTATANGVHCCQGIGNQGHDADPATSTMLPPADGFQVITVGSVDYLGDSAWFTSDGPTGDGRSKPEILARGVLSRTVDPDNDTNYVEVNGASFATPTSAGAIACVVQTHPEWTVDQMRWAVTHTADYYVANGTYDPLFIRGYGILNALDASNSDPPAPGDLDEDGSVDITDFFELLAAWGPCAEPCPPHCFADINTDCTVDVVDFFLLLANWG
jgi:subtilisin family serine protease